MVIVKWSDAMKGPRVKVDGPLFGGLCKEYHGYIVPWSGTDPDAKLDSFTWSKKENDWIVLGYQYNEDFKNWRGPIHNGQFCPHTLKKKRRTERICSKSSGSVKFNGITREGNQEILKYYKDQCYEHMIRNIISYV